MTIKYKSKYYQYQPESAGKIVYYARKKMYKVFMEFVKPTPETTILDVGVTSDKRVDCNFFEKFYPYPHMITAVGTEDASFLEKDYPGLKFLKFSGKRLPFDDKSFDTVVCFATIEHIGSHEQQRAFIHDLCRVGHTCFITTPNRWYPLEFHTVLPFVHWLPNPWFREILKFLGKHFYANEDNLNLLSKKELISLLPKNVNVHVRYFRLFGMVSNLMFFVEN